jgi:hypothetical protein
MGYKQDPKVVQHGIYDFLYSGHDQFASASSGKVLVLMASLMKIQE